jgi:hypothetical protein
VCVHFKVSLNSCTQWSISCLYFFIG